MKNIQVILKETGYGLTESQKESIIRAVNENYKPVADWQKQINKIKMQKEKLNSLQQILKETYELNTNMLKQMSELHTKMNVLTDAADKKNVYLSVKKPEKAKEHTEHETSSKSICVTVNLNEKTD